MSKQRPLAGYCNTIRRIAYFTQALAPAFRSIKWQVAEHLEYDSTLEQRWAQFLKVCFSTCLIALAATHTPSRGGLRSSCRRLTNCGDQVVCDLEQ